MKAAPVRWRLGDWEIEVFNMLQAVGFQGVLICDDIHLNQGMRDFWAVVRASGIPYYDVSFIGHATGTGLVDFTRQLVFVP